MFLFVGAATMQIEASVDAMNLAQLPAGQSARILALDLEEGLCARMHALGLTPGQSVQVIRRARFNGPLQVRAGTTDIILRVVDAGAIMVEGDLR